VGTWPELGPVPVYEDVRLLDDRLGLYPSGGGSSALAFNEVGAGVVYLAGEFGISLPASDDWQVRDRTVRIQPPDLRDDLARLMLHLFEDPDSPGDPSLLGLPEPAQDVELALMANEAGDYLLFAINWTTDPAHVDVAWPRRQDGGVGDGFALGPDGTVREMGVLVEPHGRFFLRRAVKLDLAPQEAVVLRFAAQ